MTNNYDPFLDPFLDPVDPVDPVEIMDFLKLDEVKNENLSSLEIDCLNKVSECIVEMRAIIRLNLNGNNLKKNELDFIYDALNACQKIPKIIAENHSSIYKSKNNLDWLLRSNLDDVTTVLNKYYDYDPFNIEIEKEKKESISKLPHIVLGASISFISIFILGMVFYIIDNNQYKHNSYQPYQDLEHLEEVKEPDPKYNEVLEQVGEYEK